jgi:hypothetical protein
MLTNSKMALAVALIFATQMFVAATLMASGLNMLNAY